MIWLRNNLRKDFPYSYVKKNNFFNNQVPPVESVDYRENFIQNHFHRIAKMPHLRTSETLKLFLKDDTFKSIKSKYIFFNNLEKSSGKVEELMHKYLEEKFMDSDSGDLFKMFEKKYNKKILEKIKKFKPENLESNDIFNCLFKDVSETTKENSKLFSKLKHE